MAGEVLHSPSWMQVKLLTIPEVAQWAKVSTKTVYRWIDEGRIEAIRFGNRTCRIPEQSIKKLLTVQGYSNLIDGNDNNP